MPFADLRQFLAYLEERGDLLHVQEEVDPKHEIAAYIRKTSDTDGPALYFHRVKGHRMPVVGGVFANRRRALYSVEATEQEVLDKYWRGIRNPLPVRQVKSAPCQEVVLLGDEVDLTRLPVPTFSAGDAGAFITIGIVISKDPETGGKNAAIYRLQVKGSRKLGILSGAYQHLGIQHSHAEANPDSSGLEVAIAIGCDPAIPFASQWKAPFGVDELTLAGGLRGEPVEVVRCRTVDLEVPATAEIVIEGRIPPGVREVEGPFGEVTGYQTEAYPKPIIEVTAVTHRRDPIFQAALTGMPTTENHILKQFPVEATYYTELKGKFPGVKAVHFPGAGTVGFLCIVSLKQDAKYEARNVIAHMLGTMRNKVIIVVDDDIDPFSLEQVMWAVCTRSQPDQDVVIFPRLLGSGLDPSTPERGSTCGMGIDATRPFGEPFPEMVRVPGVEQVPDLKALLAQQQGRS